MPRRLSSRPPASSSQRVHAVHRLGGIGVLDAIIGKL
jgi:hypothetical protein